MIQTALGLIMISNAALFFFGALQHAGISIGSFHEPKIIPAFIVETICGLFLLWGGVAIFGHLSGYWGIALRGNLVALAGVLLGVVALAIGRGHRTASNDLYHRMMLVLIGVSLLLLFFVRTGLQRK
jgi:hypothetical protein